MKQIVKVTGLIGLQRKRCDMAHIIDESSCKMRCCNKCDMYRKELKHYKDLEEKGLLVELPCKVGDTVYNITGGKLSEETVMAINIGINRNKGSMGIITENFRYANVLHENIDFGDTVFLTQSEAEQALADMK